MTRALTLGLLVLSSVAHAGGTIVFHRDKPADLNAKGQDHFKAGELIYAVAKLKKPLGQLDNGRGLLGISVQGNGSGYGGIQVPITDANKNDSQVGFYLIGPGQDEKTTKTFVNWLGEQGPTAKLAVGIGGGFEAVGKLTIDMSPGKDAYAAVIAESAKATLAANAKVALPKAAQSNPKLENEILAMLKTEVPHMKIHKVILVRPDWSIERHPATGIILRRSMFAALLSEQIKTGTCLIEPTIAIEQPSTGPNTWGKLTRGGGTASESIKVPCERFRQP